MRHSSLFIIVLVVLVIACWRYAQYAIALILAPYVLRLLARIYRFVRSTVTSVRLSVVDSMDGIEFEKYVARMLKRQGYSQIRLTEKYDYGVDIVAAKDGVRWGIQAKRYSGLVKAEAVRQVVTGLRVYGCDHAIVIINSVFSRVAVQLADSNECVLVDRKELARMKTDLKR